VFLRNNEDQFRKEGEWDRNKGEIGFYSQAQGISERFCGAFNGFKAAALRLFWRTNANKKLFFYQSQVWDCFWGG
jgi:hypothetical protein